MDDIVIDVPDVETLEECLFCSSHESCAAIPEFESVPVSQNMCKVLGCVGLETIVQGSVFCFRCMDEIKIMMQLYTGLEGIQNRLNSVRETCEAKLEITTMAEQGDEDPLTTSKSKRNRKLIFQSIRNDSPDPREKPQDENSTQNTKVETPEPRSDPYVIHNTNVLSVTAYLRQPGKESSGESSGSGSDDSDDASKDGRESSGSSGEQEGSPSYLSAPTGIVNQSLVFKDSSSLMSQPNDAESPEEKELKSKYKLRDCSIRLEKYSRPDLLGKLNIRRFQKGSFLCLIKGCNKGFVSRRERNDHITSQHLGLARPYKCRTCSLSFVTDKKREKHEASHSAKAADKPTLDRYICRTCGKACKSLIALSCHSTKHTSKSRPTPTDQPMVCEYANCTEVFSDTASYSAHMKKDHFGIALAYSCHLCPSKFATVADQKDHQNIHTNSTPHACPFCEQMFPTKDLLTRHTKFYHNSDHINCVFCHYTAMDIEEYKDHLMRHINETPFVCEFCGLGHRKEAALRMHLQTTHPEANISFPTCPMCKKTFKSERSLNDHIRLHTKDFRYLCEVCSYGSMRKSHLVKHMDTHSLENNYECNICFKKFKTSDNLRSHKRAVHDVSKHYPCDVCYKRFINSDELGRHKRRAHDEKRPPKSCLYCSKVFVSEVSLNKHVANLHGNQQNKGGSSAGMNHTSQDLFL